MRVGEAPTAVTPAGMLMLVKPLFSNVLVPKVVSLLGSVMEVSDGVFLNI